jgi:hypothetical protein
MIKCINCGNNTVMARFPSQIILSAEVTIPGEVETRILSDSLEERSEPRLIHWNLDHGDLQIGDLSPDDADEYRCRDSRRRDLRGSKCMQVWQGRRRTFCMYKI